MTPYRTPAPPPPPEPKPSALSRLLQLSDKLMRQRLCPHTLVQPWGMHTWTCPTCGASWKD